MPLYDYRCPDGHIHEALRPMDADADRCPCGRTSYRVGANRVAVVGPAEDSRGMFRRFDEASQELAYTAHKNEQPSALPGLWQRAKRRTRAMVAAGEATVRKESPQ